jgi:uncharacterized membrane protein (DUF4010 family)
MIGPFAVPAVLVQVAVATAIGALIGLERERQPARKYAGLRTLALLCGAGPTVVYLAQETGEPAVVPVALGIYLGLAAALALAVAFVRFVLRGEELGFTTSVTVFVVALLGILVGYERFVEATSIGILVVVLLSERERLHSYVDSLSDQELRDSLKLGALLFVLYPVSPTEPVDPYGVVVLREVLLFAIFVLLIEFGSYVLMRQIGGSKGLAVTGLLAGGANSFATAGVLAGIANRSREAVGAASFALLLATTSMIVRNVAIAVVLATAIGWQIWQPAAAMVVVAVALAVVVWRHSETPENFGIDFDSPFSFRSAATFSAAYVAILLLSVGAETTVGDAGLYGTALAGGLVSSAAVSVTAATVLNDGTAGVGVAVGMVVLGIVASLAAKIALVWVANREMRRTAVLPMAAVAVAGLAVFVLV